MSFETLVPDNECLKIQGDGDPEEDSRRMALGMTVLVKRRDQIPDDLYADVKYIFHTSHLRILDSLGKKHATVLRSPLRSQAKLNQYQEQLELPRRLPNAHDLSQSLVLFLQGCGPCSVMVFLIDTRDLSMFHVLTRRFKEMDPYQMSIGYAVSGERLYFVGGSYSLHHDWSLRLRDAFNRLVLEREKPRKKKRYDKRNKDYCDYDYGSLWREAEEKVKSTVAKHLDVPTYNLRRKEWESTPCLIASKPNPVVFAYEGKIFALRGYNSFNLPGDSPTFEFLDTNCPNHTPPCWTELPAPRFDMKEYHNHILDEENGIFFLFFDSHDYKINRYSCQLNLKEKPYRWKYDPISKSNSRRNPDPIDPGSSVGLRMRHISHEQSQGCIVDNIIFSYEIDEKSGPGRPIILGKYVGCDKSGFGPWVIHDLDKALVGNVETFGVGYLNHIGKYRFCLIVEYSFRVGTESETNALYSLIFDLVKEDLPNEFRMIKTRNSSKAQRANKFKFVFEPVSERAFQVPYGFTLMSSFLTKE